MLFQKSNIVANTNHLMSNNIENERHDRINRSWARYDGNFPKSLRPTKSDPNADDNICINLALFTVNLIAYFLYGKAFEFEIDGQKESPEEDWLDKCWEDNEKEATLLDAAINGSVTGDVFLRLQKAMTNEEFPSIHVLNSGNVEVVTNPDNYKSVLSYVNQWSGKNPITGKMTAYRQTFSRFGLYWKIFEEESAGDSNDWNTTNEEIHPYSWEPIFHCKNAPNPNSYYGRSDIEDDLLNMNEDLNFIVSNIARIIRIHGHPKTWGRGFEARELDMSIDSLTILKTQTGELKNLEMHSDLAASLEFAKEIKQMYHQMAGIPEIAAGKVENIGQLSGLALEILYGPLTRLIQTKRLYHGRMLRKLSLAMMEMGGKKASAIAIQWSELLPKNRKEEAETAVILKDVGVSQDTVLTELHYDPVNEAEKRQAEIDAQTALSSSLMNQFDKTGLQ